MQFIKATEEFNTFEKAVSAPYIRKSFLCEDDAKGKIKIAVCGFYELYLNGQKITKGFLAPYISNTDDYIYYDEYDVSLEKGENVIALILGNGFQNNPGGYIWNFDKASFRSAPMVAITIDGVDKSGNIIKLQTDETFKCFPSPIVSDDYRFGEIYDANLEISNWNKQGFDDLHWDNVILTSPPKGELKLCEAEPIIKETEIKAVEIFKEDDGYIYDFGISNAGVCRLCISGKKGQKIEMQHTDILIDGKFQVANIWFVRDLWDRDKDIVHKDVYICKGREKEEYMPTFTYHGFRYVKVKGITPKQATKDLLTYVVLHSDLQSRGGFSCSDQTVNKLQEMTRRSDISNFHYFPTDCPQREKNGWTADAAISCEQMLLNFNPEKSYREWMNNVRKSQNEAGALPGIIPTAGWGFEWGNGPAWDCVLVYLPYYTYVYRGETVMIEENAEAFIKYLKYLETKKDEKGLLHIGLGDWCHLDRETPKAPLEVTDSIISMDIANKTAFMFDITGEYEKRDFAKDFAQNIRKAIRENLIDFSTKTVNGSCQSCQAMGLYYGVFEPDEEKEAFEILLKFIHDADDHMDVGVLGGRVIFHILSKFGYSDLAFKMITRPDYPSYGNWIKRGATTLWEDFSPDFVGSPNHHFWGDISAWFIKCIAGIKYNETGYNLNDVSIEPCFISALNNAEGYYLSPFGKIVSSWKRENENIRLSLKIPDGLNATIKLRGGYVFEDGNTTMLAKSGVYTAIKTL